MMAPGTKLKILSKIKPPLIYLMYFTKKFYIFYRMILENGMFYKVSKIETRPFSTGFLWTILIKWHQLFIHLLLDGPVHIGLTYLEGPVGSIYLLKIR